MKNKYPYHKNNKALSLMLINWKTHHNLSIASKLSGCAAAVVPPKLGFDIFIWDHLSFPKHFLFLEWLILVTLVILFWLSFYDPCPSTYWVRYSLANRSGYLAIPLGWRSFHFRKLVDSLPKSGTYIGLDVE